MHQLSSGKLSLDANVVVDFYLTGNLVLLGELFGGRMLLSDFVERELAEAQIGLQEAEVVKLTTDAELQLFDSIRRSDPRLGAGEIGALTVAKLRGAILLTNDARARSTAGKLEVNVSGSLGILRYAVEAGRLTFTQAVAMLDRIVEEGAWISADLVEQFRREMRGKE